LPCLRFSKRLRPGFEQRTLATPPPRADLWIQAASVGESYLALELINRLTPPSPITILLTTNTSQGMDILEKIRREHQNSTNIKIHTAYFPFDKPTIMARAMSAVQPRAVVLLESELWPGLMKSCRRGNCKLLIINGRMTQRSLSRYLIRPSFWKELGPDTILAMSPEDGRRFGILFGHDIVDIMGNIKFDRFHSGDDGQNPTENPLRPLFEPESPFIVLGSVRKEEEEDLEELLRELRPKNPQAIIGLFPRHMQRLDHWQKNLSRLGLQWQLRSATTGPVKQGTIILWDVMGELAQAYELAWAAFVGGSLAPLGGQNFLEPLSCGLRPVIGPYWDNFSWIGREIMDRKLVFEAKDRWEVAEYLLENIHTPPRRAETRQALQAYIRNRQGGTGKACKLIIDSLFQ